jgi:hypothetical protein
MLPTPPQLASTMSNMGSSNWLCFIPGQEGLALRLTKFSIPEVSCGVTTLGNRTEFALQTSGDHITHENLDLEFIVDENLLTYIKLYQWMRRNAKVAIEESTSVFVHLVDNEKKFQGIQIEFYDAFPIALSRLDLETIGTDTDVHTTVTMAYTAFDFVGITDIDADIIL